MLIHMMKCGKTILATHYNLNLIVKVNFTYAKHDGTLGKTEK